MPGHALSDEQFLLQSRWMCVPSTHSPRYVWLQLHWHRASREGRGETNQSAFEKVPRCDIL